MTDRGIQGGFQSNKRFDVRLYTEYLDLSRFAGPPHRHNIAEYLVRKYAGSKVDTIIAVYLAAVDVVLGEARDAFSEVPIVACEVTKSYVEKLQSSPSRRRVTGVMGGRTFPVCWMLRFR